MIPLRRRSRARKGMTLVELLMAVGLTAILMWGILQLYTQASRFSATMFAEAELVAGGRAVLDRLCHELTSVSPLNVGYLKLSNDSFADPYTLQIRDNDALQFVAPVGPDGQLCHVRYNMGPDGMLFRTIVVPDSTGTPVLNQPTDLDTCGGTRTTSPLGIKVDSINVQYINYDSTFGSPSPDTGWSQQVWNDIETNDDIIPRLPRAVLVQLKLSDNKGTVTIVVSSGAFLGGSGI